MKFILNTDNPLETFRCMYGQCMIDKLNSCIKDCNECGTNYRKNEFYGNPNANIMIINDTACDDEEVDEYFNDLLNMSDIDTSDVFIVNAVSCYTTRKDRDNIVQRIPSKKECNNCKHFLKQAIKIVNPRIIISLGAIALNQFICPTSMIEYANTKQVFDGIPALVNFSIKDLFDLCAYKSEEEIQEISNSLLEQFNEAAKYVNSITK